MSFKTEVHTLSFRFPDHTQELNCQRKVMAFPLKWKQFIDDLGQEPEWKNRRQYPPGGGSLKKLLLALLPDLTAVNFNLTPSQWLYSTTAIDTGTIHRIISVWMETTFSEYLPKATIQRKLEQMEAGDLQWEDASFNLAETLCNEWGTASPKYSEGYALLPDLLGEALTQTNRTLPFGSHRLNFYRSPIVGRNGIGSGLELFSWSPLVYQTKRHSHNWFYSPFLILTLQTIPYQSYPVIHVDVGLRRWVSTPSAKLDYDDHNLYLLPRLAREEAAFSNRRFQTTSITRKKDKTKPAGEGFYWGWADSLPFLFAEYFPDSPLPDPHEIIRDPANFISGDHKLKAVIPYHNRIRPDHAIGSGAQPRERKQLADSITEILHEKFGLIATGILQRVNDRGKEVQYCKSIFHMSAYEKEDRQKTERLKANAHETFSQRRLITASTISQSLHIDVRYISGEVHNALLKAMSDTFGQPTTKSADGWLWDTGEIRIKTSSSPLGDLVNKLEDKSPGAFWRRVDEVNRANHSSQHRPDGMLIEIPGKDEFKEVLDPKDALRVGQAHNGIVTQFINPQPEDGLAIRAEKALLDLLRQLGAIDGLPDTKPKAFTREVNCAAVWMLKMDEGPKEFLPMMIYLPLHSPQVLAIAHGLGDFIPYSRFLLWLTQRRNSSGKSIPGSNVPAWLNWQDRPQVGNIVKDWLLKRLPQRQDLLLMTHAQNSRSYWNWLANNSLTRDSICFESGTSITASELPNLRVVRLRESDSGETPQVFAISVEDAKKMSYPNGICRLSDRVFYSIPSKPASRVNQKPDKPKALNPEMQGWNPTLLEMAFPILQADDNSDATRWALLTHKLRRAAFHFADDLALPLPLHLAQKAEEYVFSQCLRR